MAGLNPQFGVVAGRGAVLIGAKGATAPTLTALTTFAGDPTKFPAGFAPFGVTHPDELPEFERDGGDEKQLFVWEYAAPVASFREDEPVNSFTVNGLEFANDTMRLYEGGGDATGAGIFWAPTNPVPTEASALVVLLSKVGKVRAYFAPFVTITGADAISHESDDWSKIPLRFTELFLTGQKGPHAWIGEGLGATA